MNMKAILGIAVAGLLGANTAALAATNVPAYIANTVVENGKAQPIQIKYEICKYVGTTRQCGSMMSATIDQNSSLSVPVDSSTLEFVSVLGAVTPDGLRNYWSYDCNAFGLEAAEITHVANVPMLNCISTTKKFK